MTITRFLASLAAVTLAASAWAQEIKNPAPPSAGSSSPGLLGTPGAFGPDAFGYVGFDESQPECTFDFIDISATGTVIGTGDDVGFPVTLPGAPFELYDETVSEVSFTSNGYISTDLTDTGPDLSNDCPLPFPPSTGGGARIYPVHDDINMVDADGGALIFQHFPSCPRPSGWGGDEGCYVFQWDNARHFGGTDSWDFQAILYETSFGIVFQHGPGNPELGSGSTTGIQNAAATIGLTYACDTPSTILDNSAQCIYHPAFPFGAGAVAPIPEPQAVPATGYRGIVLLGVMLGLFGLIAVRRFR